MLNTGVPPAKSEISAPSF